MKLLRLSLGLLLAGPAWAAWAWPEPLDLLRTGLGGRRFMAVETFAYRLTVTDLTTGRVVRDARYRLEAATGRLEYTDIATGENRLWDGQAGWRVTATGREPLPAADAEDLRNHVAYHFVRLFHDPATRLKGTDVGYHWHLIPASADAFMVVVDPTTGRILENHFGPELVSLELDHREIDGVVWPMTFELRKAGTAVRRGTFSEVQITFR